MLLAKWIYTVFNYLHGSPPLTATFNTEAVINVYVHCDQESAGPARKKRKTGIDRVEWLLKCDDEFPKPVRHEKAMRSNVTMKKRTLKAIIKDTNERSNLHRKTNRTENYFQ